MIMKESMMVRQKSAGGRCGLVPLLLAACLWAPSPGLALDARHDPRLGMTKLRERTGKTAEESMHFVVFGDSKLSPKMRGLLKFADVLKPDFCLTTGDLVNHGAGPRGAVEWKLFQEQAGWFLTKYPTWPTFGNHENKSREEDDPKDGPEQFKAFFGVDTKYSFTYGNAKFICTPGMARRSKDAELLKWLETELKTGGKKHLFILTHYPFYSPGTRGTNKETKITRLLAKYKVKAVFTGHDHCYYRTQRDQIQYIISAGAGAGVYWLSKTDILLKDDVYYFRKGKYEGDYFFHHPDLKQDRIFKQAMIYLCDVQIKGDEVTIRLLNAKDGKEWDRVVLKSN